MGFSFHSFDHPLTPPLFDACGLWGVEAHQRRLLEGFWVHGLSQSCWHIYLPIHLLSKGLIVKSCHRRLSMETSIGRNAKARCVMYWATIKRNHTYDPLDWLWPILVSTVYLNDRYHSPEHTTGQNIPPSKAMIYSKLSLAKFTHMGAFSTLPFQYHYHQYERFHSHSQTPASSEGHCC